MQDFRQSGPVKVDILLPVHPVNKQAKYNVWWNEIKLFPRVCILRLNEVTPVRFKKIHFVCNQFIF